MISAKESIAAVSTPVGEGAIALVRISGRDAIEIADKIFRGKAKPSEFPSHVQQLGEIVDRERFVDQVMLSVHRMPSSYTGEDLVEITCHGGALVSARVLEACLRVGARAAEPGEFTERAFHNGKMDLTQAEAVIDLIRAQTDLALRSATEQLQGRLGRKIGAIRDELVALLAHVNAAIDFPEEGIAPDEGGKLRARFDTVQKQIDELLATAEQGRILREGLRVVIYGATNAGKSSLLNRLLGYDRAIVSDAPGTTRDTIEEVINLRGIPIRITDTAGLRPSIDAVEREGINRTEKTLVLGDLLLHIVDANAPKPIDFGERATGQAELLLLNKSDLPEHADWSGSDALRISCLTEDGFARLQETIVERITQKNLGAQSALAINARHRDCLRRAYDCIDRARKAFDEGISGEYLAIDLNGALAAVGEVIGTVDVEDILDSVFSQFCIGK
jgi:tRNA modification GTPase